MTNMKTYWTRRCIAKLLRKPMKREKRYCSLQMAKTIFVLYNHKQSSEIMPILQKLQKEGFKINTLVYYAEATEDFNKYTWNAITCSEQDLNFFGKLSKELINKTKSINADILINLAKQEDIIPLYLTLLHTCPFKAGIKEEENSCYDFAIKGSNKHKTGSLFEHLLHYLKSIHAG